MDHWDSLTTLRAPRIDVVRKWADMEGKSPTMREDLYQSRVQPGAPPRNVLTLLVTSVKIVTAMVHAWVSDSR